MFYKKHFGFGSKNNFNISGNPTNDQVGTYGLLLKATDLSGGVSKAYFNLVVENTNDAPEIANIITDKTVNEDDEFSYTIDNTEFIEKYDVPLDAFVINHTWQYANKSGKIDKRFKFNRKIPITHYSKLTFKVLSKDVAITLHLSRAYMGLEFSNMLKDMATFCKSSKIY